MRFGSLFLWHEVEQTILTIAMHCNHDDYLRQASRLLSFSLGGDLSRSEDDDHDHCDLKDDQDHQIKIMMMIIIAQRAG